MYGTLSPSMKTEGEKTLIILCYQKASSFTLGALQTLQGLLDSLSDDTLKAIQAIYQGDIQNKAYLKDIFKLIKTETPNSPGTDNSKHREASRPPSPRR